MAWKYALLDLQINTTIMMFIEKEYRSPITIKCILRRVHKNQNCPHIIKLLFQYIEKNNILEIRKYKL